MAGPVHSAASAAAIVAAALAMVLLHGCGGYFPPSPTTRPVVVGDLVGTWTYQPMVSGASVRLVLRGDGSFDQVVTLPTGGMARQGRWRIDGSELVLEEALVEFNGWQAEPQSWPIIDRSGSPTGFSILGGGLDPDTWVVFAWSP